MKKVIFLLLITLFNLPLQAQITQGPIVNSYAAIVAADPCNNTFIVDNTSGFAVGDTVLMIQMKGAVIDSSNTAAFGNITSYAGAGNHELNTIKAITGTHITLNYTVQRTYNIPRGRVQLVRVPSAVNHTVGSNLTCQPWNGAKGGVLAIIVHNTLTLNADIDVSGKGFTGANVVNITGLTCNQTNYFYPITSNLGACKGEGIGEVSNGKMAGRGTLANGGGGGNSHNSGGAGGGNGGAGGSGGNQYDLNFMCSNFIPVLGGIGGRALNYSNTPQRLFLGAGGGGGHTNEQTDKPGGNGGGIVLIMANTIIGNGKAINANGGNVIECSGPTPGCANDGHSGGGAGGSVALSVNSITGPFTVSVKGGKGADAWVFATTVGTTGPGGGGGGGAVWYKTGTVPVGTTNVLTAGMNGVAPQYGNTNWNAQPGQAGLVKNDYSIGYPVSVFTPKIFTVDFDETLLYCMKVDFKGNGSVNNGTIVSWDWSFGDGGTSTQQNPSHTYTSAGTYQVKLKITDNDGCVDSIIKSVAVSFIPFNTGFTDTLLHCRIIDFKDTGTLSALTWNWDFGDGNTSTQQHPRHSYNSDGTYQVKLVTTYGPGCKDSVMKSINAAFIPFAVAGNDTSICPNNNIILSATGGVSYLWMPAEGIDDPQSANTKANPAVATVYIVTVTHALGCTDNDSIVVDILPGPQLTIEPREFIGCKDDTVRFNVSGAHKYLWSPVNGLSNPYFSSPLAHITDDRKYYVSATDSAGCVSKDSILVLMHPLFGIMASASPEGYGCKETTITLTANGAHDYIWHPGYLFSDSTKDVQEVVVTQPTIFVAQGISKEGCRNFDSIYVGPDFTTLVVVPDAFTPNGDGLNETIKPLIFCDFNLDYYGVYNRWGQEVFTTRQENAGWDGTYKGKAADMGVYHYHITGKNDKGEFRRYKGSFTLVR